MKHILSDLEKLWQPTLLTSLPPSKKYGLFLYCSSWQLISFLVFPRKELNYIVHSLHSLGHLGSLKWVRSMKSKMSFIYEESFVSPLPLSLKKHTILALTFLDSNYYALPLQRVRMTHRKHTYFVLIIIIDLDHCHVFYLHFLYNLYSRLAKLSLLTSPRKSWASLCGLCMGWNFSRKLDSSLHVLSHFFNCHSTPVTHHLPPVTCHLPPIEKCCWLIWPKLDLNP